MNRKRSKKKEMRDECVAIQKPMMTIAICDKKKKVVEADKRSRGRA
jgi:hypothetical protein